MSTIPLAQMHRTMVLMCSRYPAQSVDVAFVFGHAERDFKATDGDSGFLETAGKLYHLKLARFISTPGTPG